MIMYAVYCIRPFSFVHRVGRKTALSPTLSLDEGAYDLEEEADEASEQTPAKGEHDFLPEPQETSFATAIREVFASYFVEHFANYENFIIMPKQSYDQWKKNREQFQNFDKTAFLSDQPINYRAFYAAFVESSLFTQFVDQKIVTIWEPEKADHSLKLFDARVEQYRDKSGLAKLPTTPGPKSADSKTYTCMYFLLILYNVHMHVHVHVCTRTCTHTCIMHALSEL